MSKNKQKKEKRLVKVSEPKPSKQDASIDSYITNNGRGLEGSDRQCFKVVRIGQEYPNEGKFMSVVQHDMEIEYRLFRLSVPRVKNSPIFVFDYLEDALNFYKLHKNSADQLAILECVSVSDIRNLPVRMDITSTFVGINPTKETIAKFWNTELRNGQYFPTAGVPTGTSQSTGIIPVKVLYRSDSFLSNLKALFN